MVSGGSGCSTTSDSDGQVLKLQNELLCFIREKTNVMTVDDISKICSDFYREDEVFAVKSMVEQELPYRLPKRQGPNKCRATVDDLIKVCLDPTVSLPTCNKCNNAIRVSD